MGDLGGRAALRVIAAVAATIAVVWLALWYFIPAPPHELTIAAGIKGGAFEHIANRYKERLARHHVTLHFRYASAGGSTQLIADPKSGVSAAFLFGGLLNSETAPDLVSLGRIGAAPFWVFYRGAETLDRLSQLKGKRAYVTVATGDLVDRILAANGVKPGDLAVRPERGALEAQHLLQRGEVDVAILPPIDLNAPSIQVMLRDPNIRLMNVSQAEAITRLFPSLNRLVLPQGVIDLEKNIPPADVNLIGSTTAFVVRKDLHPELIYLLAEVMKEVHSGGGVFQRPGEFPSLTDPELPMAQEAVDYYRNGPSFLQRYLPFWMINYAKRVTAILIAAVAVVIPIFTYGPRLYAWLVNARLLQLYRRLRLVNAQLKRDLTADQVAALHDDLQSIDHAATMLPMRHSDMFFSLLMHVDMTRTRLAARLAELQPERRVA
ncbi:MAG TPA: TAXI family TRAP transporter solute-binding subunit [Pseudolabrys sp.]|nr:TAXI family TRAP transporter solute-binding subunit [Pseudolabrys sp.]